jgi:Sec-independent protein translocase protein TatA
VLGPEKLPRVVSEIGRWVGRARAMARQFREQLEEEVQVEQARKAQAPTSPAPAAPPVSAAPSETPVAPPDTFSHAHPTDATGADPSADERRT